jgi:hypothetical protein
MIFRLMLQDFLLPTENTDTVLRPYFRPPDPDDFKMTPI